MTTLIELISIIKDSILSIAAVVGTYVALRGINTWNRQLKGGVEYELARKVLIDAYRFREGIKSVRNPVMLVEEQPSPSKEEREGMTSEQLQYYGIFRAYQARWEKMTELNIQLDADLLEAEALWGDKVKKLFDLLFKLRGELFANIHCYLIVCNPYETSMSRKSMEELLSGQPNIRYDKSSSEPDEFAAKLYQRYQI